MWYVSQVEKNMGKTGTSAVNAPILPCPYPTAAVSNRLAKVQFSESMPWLEAISYVYGALGYIVTYSNSSPSGLDVPVRRACLPSTLSMVEYLNEVSVNREDRNSHTYIHMPKAKLKYTHDGA